MAIKGYLRLSMHQYYDITMIMLYIPLASYSRLIATWSHVTRYICSLMSVLTWKRCHCHAARWVRVRRGWGWGIIFSIMCGGSRWGWGSAMVVHDVVGEGEVQWGHVIAIACGGLRWGQGISGGAWRGGGRWGCGAIIIVMCGGLRWVMTMWLQVGGAITVDGRVRLLN